MSEAKATIVRKPISFLMKSGSLHSLVLCIALFLTATIPSVYYSLMFLFMLIVYLYSYRTRLDGDASRVLRPVIGMVLLGIVFSFNNNVIDISRDVWYAGKAIVCFLLGYHVARKITNTNLFFNFFIRISFLSALIYLASILIGPDKIGIESASSNGGPLLVSAMAVPLILFRKTGFIFKVNPALKILIILVITASFALSFSRTSIGCFLLIVFVGSGFFNNIKKFLMYVAFAGVLTILIAPMLPTLDAQNLTFLGKIKNSFLEISFTDDSDMSDMLVNWRGFEAHRAYVAFANSSLLQQIFGRGWGATVDLGFAVQMSKDMSYQYLPILHNGYMHILSKYGIVGLFLYLVFLWRIVVGSRHYFAKTNNVPYARFITGLGLVLAYTSLVITGIMNKGRLDSVLIVLGILFGSAYCALKKSNRSQPVQMNQDPLIVY